MNVPVVIVAGLLLLATLLIISAPFFLSRGAWRLRRPRLALALWHAVFLGGLAASAASLVCTVGFVAAMGDRTRQTQFWIEPTALVIFGWLGLAGVGALLSLLVSRAEPIAQADRELQARFSILAAQSESRHQYGVDVVIVEANIPVALSIPGPEARVVIASLLVHELTPDELRAVIEHERAHLLQRHGRMVQLAQLNRACLPMLPAARDLERTTQLLVELIADDAAARRSGAVHLANALAKVGALSNDESLLLRARRVAARPPRGSLGRRGTVHPGFVSSTA